MNQGARAADVPGHETLDIMRQAPAYAAWQVERIAPFLGRRILEVGSGTGNISVELLATRPEHLVLTDMDAAYRDRLTTEFSTAQGVRVDALTLPDPAAPSHYAGDGVDSIVALNVVEHIQDDAGAVATMREIVRPGGHVIILVPALQAIFGTLDTELGHYRRYSRRSLTQLLQGAGLKVVHTEWFNRVGVIGWWFNGKIRRTPRIPLTQLRHFDALVPLLRWERMLPLPFGQSVIGVGRRP